MEQVDNSNTIQDFIYERLIFKVFGGYYVFQKPLLYFIINVSLIVCVFFMILFLFLMGIYTLAVASPSPALRVQIYFILIAMPIAVVAPTIRFTYRRNINTALKLLKAGIDQYSCELPDEEHENIKKKRVGQVHLCSHISGIMCCLSAVSNMVQFPIMQIISSGEKNSNDAINFYLPLPFYMPYDTRTYHGYIIAFLSNALYLSILHTALFCYVETNVSSSLQLVAQMEILNHSLTNIEKRAIRLKQGHTGPGCSDMNKELELQKCLYHCLRTNIQHHQTIIRFSQEVKEYVGAMNTYNIINFGLIFATTAVPFIQDPVNNFLLSLAVLSLELIEFLQVFWAGQEIVNTSADTMYALYSTPWTHCSKNYNILLNLMMTNAKKQIVLRSPTFNLDWTFETFGLMLSGGYKLTNLLLNTI